MASESAREKLAAARDDPSLLVETYGWFVKAYQRPVADTGERNAEVSGQQGHVPPARLEPEPLLELAEMCADGREFDLSADLAAKFAGRRWEEPGPTNMQLCRAHLCEARSWAASMPAGQNSREALESLTKALAARADEPLSIPLGDAAAAVFWAGARPSMRSGCWPSLHGSAVAITAALTQAQAADQARGSELTPRLCACQLVLARCQEELGDENAAKSTVAAVHSSLLRAQDDALSASVAKLQLAMRVMPATISALGLSDPLLNVEVRV